MREPTHIRFSYDSLSDTLEVDGVKIGRSLIRSLARVTPEGRAYRVVKIVDGVATVKEIEVRAAAPVVPILGTVS